MSSLCLYLFPTDFLYSAALGHCHPAPAAVALIPAAVAVWVQKKSHCGEDKDSPPVVSDGCEVLPVSEPSRHPLPQLSVSELPALQQSPVAFL